MSVQNAVLRCSEFLEKPSIFWQITKKQLSFQLFFGWSIKSYFSQTSLIDPNLSTVEMAN